MKTKRNVLITGATGGMGNAIAKRFANEDHHLILQYRNLEKIKRVKEELEKFTSVDIVEAELTDYDQCVKMFDYIKEKYGKLDVLVNNAGITRDALTLNMTVENYQKVIDINLTSYFYLMKLAALMMIEEKYGKIISISSIIGIMGNRGQINYAASKAGVIAMTKSLSKELAKKGINVNCIAPGFINTDMTKGLEDMYKDNVPMKRFGNPDEVANCVYFLASDEASYVNGATLVVDGGFSN